MSFSVVWDVWPFELDVLARESKRTGTLLGGRCPQDLHLRFRLAPAVLIGEGLVPSPCLIGERLTSSRCVGGSRVGGLVTFLI